MAEHRLQPFATADQTRLNRSSRPFSANQSSRWERLFLPLCSHWRARASAELGGGKQSFGHVDSQDVPSVRGTREPFNLKAEILGMRGVIHHLDLTVKDPEQVFGF